MVFTARSNFQWVFLSNPRRCRACDKSLYGVTALVLKWDRKENKEGTLVVCNSKCWEIFDHNFWLERAARTKFMHNKEDEAIQLLDSRI